LRLSQTGWRRLALALALVFTALNTANALYKGGDAAVFFEGGRRFLHRLPLYDGSSAADGFIGPPFQAMFFAPFAAIGRVSPAAAKLAWYGLNLACLFVGIRWTLHAWAVTRRRLGLPCPPWLPGLLAPIAAVLLAVQTNFEHQNMNALLLALLAGATLTLTLGAPLLAGVLIGSATALKAFPALVILFLAVRRHWAAFVAAVMTSVGLTLLPVLAYGPTGLKDHVLTFWRLGTSGWPVRANNQSLIAAIDRWTGGADVAGIHTAGDAPLAIALFAVAAVILIATAIAMLPKRRTDSTIACEMAAATILAVLLTPIAWDHYWMLMFPAFAVAYFSVDDGLTSRSWRAAFWVAAALTSGFAPVTVGRAGFDLARALSANTIAALVLYVAVLMICRGVKRKVGFGF
jgi:alpha-1,2-mannosyltransferase